MLASRDGTLLIFDFGPNINLLLGGLRWNLWFTEQAYSSFGNPLNFRLAPYFLYEQMRAKQKNIPISLSCALCLVLINNVSILDGEHAKHYTC